MKKFWIRARDVLLCATPFIFVAFLCHTLMSYIVHERQFQGWHAGFFSYLPFAFALVSIVLYLNLKELRELQAAIEHLREELRELESGTTPVIIDTLGR